MYMYISLDYEKSYRSTNLHMQSYKDEFICELEFIYIDQRSFFRWFFRNSEDFL